MIKIHLFKPTIKIRDEREHETMSKQLLLISPDKILVYYGHY